MIENILNNIIYFQYIQTFYFILIIHCIDINDSNIIKFIRNGVLLYFELCLLEIINLFYNKKVIYFTILIIVSFLINLVSLLIYFLTRKNDLDYLNEEYQQDYEEENYEEENYEEENNEDENNNEEENNNDEEEDEENNNEEEHYENIKKIRLSEDCINEIKEIINTDERQFRLVIRIINKYLDEN